MENSIKPIRTHRVGTYTAGVSMIIFGCMFLARLFVETLNYRTIFSLWPVILIGLGIELLLSNVVKKKLVYDAAAIVLLFVMAFFAMGMAVVDICMRWGYAHI